MSRFTSSLERAYETINELLSEAAGDPKARPGVVAVAQTFGSVLNAHPHTHCLASRGVWDEKGQWLPVPYIDTTAAEKTIGLQGRDRPEDRAVRVQVDNIRQLGESHALVDAMMVFAPNGENPIREAFVFVVRADEDVWRIVSARAARIPSP